MSLSTRSLSYRANQRFSRKRARSQSVPRAVVPRRMSYVSVPKNSIVVARVVDFDMTMTTDQAHGVGWSPVNLWVDGAAAAGIPGASEITAIFDCCQIQKVECTFIYACNSLEQTTTSTMNLPTIYSAYDPNDNAAPTLANIREKATCIVARLDVPFKRTIYPKLDVYGGNMFLDSGSQFNAWLKTGVDGVYNGMKFYIDNYSLNTTNTVRLSMKVFYRCRLPQ